LNFFTAINYLASPKSRRYKPIVEIVVLARYQQRAHGNPSIGEEYDF